MNAELVAVRIPRTDGAPPYEGLVAILEEDGLTGVGEAAVIAGRRAAAEACAREIAGLDLAARRAGVRVVDLLGGARREAVECSALVTDRRPAAVARDVDRRMEAGFRAFKLKSADAGGELDIERLGAARRATGGSARLRVDFNGALSPGRAVAVLATLEQFGLELVEQPIPPGSAESWLALQAATALPLAADESLGDPETACHLARAGAALALKLATVGGPRAALALAAAATGRLTVGSGMESSIGLAAGLHVACALPAAPLACGLATLDRLEGDLGSGLATGPELELPAGPGLGVELDRAALERYRVDR